MLEGISSLVIIYTKKKNYCILIPRISREGLMFERKVFLFNFLQRTKQVTLNLRKLLQFYFEMFFLFNSDDDG